MSNTIIKQSFLLIKSIFFAIIFILGYYYFSNMDLNFFQNVRFVNLSDATSLSIQYLWTTVQTENFFILLFITLLILIIIVHVIIIYQEGFDKNHGN